VPFRTQRRSRRPRFSARLAGCLAGMTLTFSVIPAALAAPEENTPHVASPTTTTRPITIAPELTPRVTPEEATGPSLAVKTPEKTDKTQEPTTRNPAPSENQPDHLSVVEDTVARPLRQTGRWTTDDTGRIVTFHGVNAHIDATAQTTQAQTTQKGSVSVATAVNLAQEGLNLVRLSWNHAALEPIPGHYDQAYLQRLTAAALAIEKAGARVLPVLGSSYDDTGAETSLAPWAVSVTGRSQQTAHPPPQSTNTTENTTITLISPSNKETDKTPQNPGLESPAPDSAHTQAALQSLDLGGKKKASDGRDAGEIVADAWEQVAKSLQSIPAVAGYDLFDRPLPSEPSSQSCLFGCHDAEYELANFYDTVAAGVRRADGERILLHQPYRAFSLGAETLLPQLTNDKTGFSFQIDCPAEQILPIDALAAETLDRKELCERSGDFVVDHAVTQAAANSEVPFLSAFGDEDPALVDEIANQADEKVLSWVYASNGKVLDQEILDTLIRPFALAVAGIPEKAVFDSETGRFAFTYRLKTEKPQTENKDSVPAALTEIFLPDRHYGDGHEITFLRGATIVSKPGEQPLQLSVFEGAKKVEIVIEPDLLARREKARNSSRRR